MKYLILYFKADGEARSIWLEYYSAKILEARGEGGLAGLYELCANGIGIPLHIVMLDNITYSMMSK